MFENNTLYDVKDIGRYLYIALEKNGFVYGGISEFTNSVEKFEAFRWPIKTWISFFKKYPDDVSLLKVKDYDHTSIYKLQRDLISKIFYGWFK